MPYVAGISFTGLVPGSNVFVGLPSSENSTYTHTFTKTIDSSDLKSTFVEITDALPEKCEQYTLSLPSYTTKAEQKFVFRAAVDPVLEALKTSPTEAGSNLKRIVITGASLVAPSLAKKVKSKLPGVEVVTDTGLYHESLADKFVFNVVPFRVGVAKAGGFVLPALARNTTLPQKNSILPTTSKDNQTSATIKVVVGTTSIAKDNVTIAELALKGLTSRAKGTTIVRVSFSIEPEGKTTIVAEEVIEEGSLAGAWATVELTDVIGDLLWDDVEDILEATYAEGDNAEVIEAEDRWVGEDAQGDLPE